MKYKSPLLVIFCSTFLLVHADNTSPTNPFNKAWSHRTGGIAAAIFHGKMGAGITKWKGKAYSWEELIQGGFFFNALYLRILLSEFYCGRCAVGVSPFTNSALAQQAAPASFPTLSSTNQPKSPGLLPGGFDAKVINTFFNKGKGYVQSLQTVRKQLAPLNDYANNTKFGTNKPSGKTPAPNPLTTFAGVIIVPTKKFVKNLGPININNGQLFTEPRFFPYKNPTGTPTVISNPSTSSNASSTSFSVVTAPQAVTSTTKGNTSDPTSLKMILNASLKNHPENSVFCNLSLSAWKSTANLNGKPLPIRLKNLNLSVLGQEIPITVYDGWSPLTKNVTSLGHFFKYAPSNPWAIVIEIDGNLGAPSPTTGKRPINTQSRILGLVQLNPLEFSSIKNLSSLLNMPQNLYYSIQNTYDGLTDSQISQRTPTARLLRGIANGYLTSWNYKPLPNGSKTSNLMAWENEYNNRILYPTPTGLQFLENSDWAMFYGLYGCRQALTRMHIQQSAIKSIQNIIKNPKKSIPGYVGAGTSLLYQPVNTVIQKMGGIPTSTPKTPVHHKANPAAIVHHKANPKHSSSTKSPKPLTSSASIKAYKAGYKAGLIDSKNNTQRKPRKNSSAAIKAYKAGYKDGLTAAQY